MSHSFVAGQFLSRIYALSSVKFLFLNLRLCKKMTNISYVQNLFSLTCCKLLFRWRLLLSTQVTKLIFMWLIAKHAMTSQVSLIIFQRIWLFGFWLRDQEIYLIRNKSIRLFVLKCPPSLLVLRCCCQTPTNPIYWRIEVNLL